MVNPKLIKVFYLNEDGTEGHKMILPKELVVGDVY